ncbi:MAG: futalosine hydrolase, partial [Thermoleophilia bacterium]|nr:futalosine hydrolase [Thermoleophilia bacterium]
MEITSCEALRDITRGCRAILLTATEAEAGPLRTAFDRSERYLLATKTVYVGDVARRAGGEAALAIEQGPRVVLAVSGCDKANVTLVLTALLQGMDPAPALVVQAGIGGALPRAPGADGPGVGDVVIATRESYSDTGSSSPDGWIPANELGLPIAQVGGLELGGVFPLDERLARAAAGIIEGVEWPQVRPRVFVGPCVTASMATGLRSQAELTARRWGALAESMEGAAAAHACALFGLPFIEIRGISNMVDDRDRGAWDVDRAVEVAAG